MGWGHGGCIVFGLHPGGLGAWGHSGGFRGVGTWITYVGMRAAWG